MAKHQIFLIHGMGEFESGWSGQIQELIKDLLSRYTKLKAGGWADYFEFKEIVYNDVFEGWRKQWRDDSAAAAQQLTGARLDSLAASRLVEAAGVPSGDGFWRTHVLDVVLYRYLQEVAGAVCTRIENQLLTHLGSFKPAPPRYTIIAHSLGSAAVYETLHAMLTGPGGFAPAYRPANVVMIANVAAALWNRGGDCYPSVMAPSLTDHLGLCYHFASFSHPLDPFSNFRRFTPPVTWTTPPAMPDSFKSVELPARDIAHWNVHAFEHYLGHPAVHIPLLRLLTGYPDMIGPDEEAAALATWRHDNSSPLHSVEQTVLEGWAAKAATRFEDEIDVLVKFRKRVLEQPLLDGESGGLHD
jgi:hypothetical protein